ncbi:hypothetical protein EYV94_21485 [Puteibacter caeruleilacunae]|nr:hypothetical protein EYV94_21485 [Puteibacter caeruleilacunae]
MYQKIALLFMALMMTSAIYAQTNTFPAAGNVSIFQSGSSSRSYNVFNSSMQIVSRLEATSDSTGQLWLKDSAGNVRVYLKSNHYPSYFMNRLGIGTNNPSDMLQVRSVNHDDIFSIRRDSPTQGNIFDFRITCTPNGERSLDDKSLTLFATKAADFAVLSDPAKSVPQFIVKKNGFVAIGIKTPKYMLDVGGTIRSKEIKVDANGGADFVFEDDYDLRSLEEVDKFVKERKHLPDVPSAKEMEEDGVGLAEMNKLLLQKVEELTLYLIKQQKENEKLTERIQKLETLVEK